MTVIVVAALVAWSTWLAWPAWASGRLAQVLVRPRSRFGEAWSSRLAFLPGRIAFGPWARRRRSARRTLVIEAISSLAAELGAGQPPPSALELAAGEPPVWPTALAAIRLNASIPEALRSDAVHLEPSQRSLLTSIAACWEVAATTGSGLGAPIERLASSARRSEELRTQLEGELAAPRATARLLAALPVFGLAVGMVLGIDPIGWLVGSAFGWACLLGSCALISLGLAWTARIAAAVERRL